MKKYILTMILFLLLSSAANAKVVMKEMVYTHGATTLKGYIAYDDAIEGKRPGVLVVHEWWGLNDYILMRTEKLAGLGYIAFAVDMYGEGISTKDPKEAARMAGHLKGKPLMRHRALAGLKVLAENERVDPKRIAAIGFCFGGTTVLELAHSGADLSGVVSFHGGLIPPKPEDVKRIMAKFLVLHGAEDPFIKPEAIADFQESMTKGDLDWQMIFYGGAVHSFSNPGAGSDKTRGAAYDSKAAERSWEHMQQFFKEIF
jgi:dienelactone hydrolase